MIINSSSHVLPNDICIMTRDGLRSFAGRALIILLIVTVLPHGVETAATCNLLEEAETAVTNKHNEIRQKVAQKGLDKKVYGNLKGSNNLFKLTYDCTYESLAAAAIKKDCSRNSMDFGKATNFEIDTAPTDPTKDGATLAAYFENAVDTWATIKSPLSEDVIYNDDSMIDFANIINYRSLRFGCNYRLCNKKLALACAYSSNKPKKGEALYLANSKNTKGCTRATTCKKVVKADGKCDTSTGLCTTDAETIDTSSSTSTTASTVTTELPTTQIATSSSQSSKTSPATTTIPIPPTTVIKTNEGMTDNVRAKIVQMHNWRRSELAKGRVRNGKPGKRNFGTAKNMYAMRYDMDLETEAQNYARFCPRSGSAITSRHESGENIYVTNSVTIEYYDLVYEGIKSWWKKILSYGMNYQMIYTQFFENKPNAPLGFTQMAWANTYKIGCGVGRCSFGTVLVCRYRPRGNIYDQKVYEPGELCASCGSWCQDGLCPSPEL